MRDRGEQRGLDLVGLFERRGPSRPLGQVGLVDGQRRLVRKGGEQPFLFLAKRAAAPRAGHAHHPDAGAGDNER